MNKSQASTNLSQTARASINTGNKPSHRSETPPDFRGVEFKHAPRTLEWKGHGHAPVAVKAPHRTTNPTRAELIARGRKRGL